jgi:hypothetical protein
VGTRKKLVLEAGDRLEPATINATPAPTATAPIPNATPDSIALVLLLDESLSAAVVSAAVGQVPPFPWQSFVAWLCSETAWDTKYAPTPRPTKPSPPTT